MTQYNKINIKLSNSQLNKLKLATKNETEVIIRICPNMIGDSNDETNIPHELLLTDRQVSSICKALIILIIILTILIHQLILNFQRHNYQK